MANVIDALMVTLALDTTEYQKGTKAAEDATGKLDREQAAQAKRMQESAKHMTAGFNRLKNEVVSLVAVIVGAGSFKDFVATMTAGQAQLGRTAHNLGMGVREVDAFRGAMKALGGQGSDFDSFAGGIEQAMEALQRTGQMTPILQTFTRLGIRLTDMAGHVRSVKDLTMDLAEAFAKLPAQTQVFEGNNVGATGGMLAFLQQGRESAQALYTDMYRLSGATEQSTEAAKRLQSAWGAFRQEIDKVSASLYSGLTPALESTLKWATKTLDTFENKGLGSVVFGDEKPKGSKDKSKSVAQEWFEVGFQNLWHDAKPTAGGNAISRRATVHGYTSGARPQIAAPAAAPAHAQSADEMFASLERQFGLPGGLLDAMYATESGRGKNLRSPKGAIGPFQFMPATGRDYGLNSESDLMDTVKSATAAAHYMHDLLAKYGDVQKALAAYNFGSGNVDRNGMGNLPAETQGYLQKILPNLKSGATTNIVTSETKIGTINVTTQATDGPGVARSLSETLRQQSSTTANTAMSGMH